MPVAAHILYLPHPPSPAHSPFPPSACPCLPLPATLLLGTCHPHFLSLPNTFLHCATMHYPLGLFSCGYPALSYYAPSMPFSHWWARKLVTFALPNPPSSVVLPHTHAFASPPAPGYFCGTGQNCSFCRTWRGLLPPFHLGTHVPMKTCWTRHAWQRGIASLPFSLAYPCTLPSPSPTSPSPTFFSLLYPRLPPSHLPTYLPYSPASLLQIISTSLCVLSALSPACIMVLPVASLFPPLSALLPFL